jgi:glycosyltransferase involved in cell wall biosynthesis
LEERRNILFLLQVFSFLKSRLDEDIVLLIVGDGKPEDTGRYFEYSRNHQLDSSILHLPKVAQKDLWQIYGASDVMVFPTNYDIFGMVLMESMYFRVPVISSLNGGASTLIKDNFNGIIIEQFDENLWAKAIAKVLSDEVLHKRLQGEAYNTIAAVTWDQIAGDMLQAIGFG